jgi:FtsZ-binding cell division protein ZapB
MFGAIKIAMVMTVIATAGMGYLYVQKLQSDLQTARENVAKMEVAVQISEDSIATLQADVIRNAELSATLQRELQTAERYGDELRATLQKHNLTALAQKKPGLIENRMQNATDNLWSDLRSITDPNGVQLNDAGTTDSNSN